MGGARRGLEGAIAPCRNMLAPRWKVKNYFVGDFWHLQYPESRILARSSEESAPCRKIPGATHGIMSAKSTWNACTVAGIFYPRPVSEALTRM